MSKIIKYVRVQAAPIVISHALAVPDINPSSIVEPAPDVTIHNEILTKAYQEAEDILCEAEKKASEIVQKAEEQSAQTNQNAQEHGYQIGYQEGYDQGLAAAQQEINDTLHNSVAKSQQLLDLANEEYRERILASERQIIEIALAVAQKILNREVAENPISLLPIVRAALEKVQDQDQITIFVGPEDYDLLLQAKRDLQMLVGRERALTISSDTTISPGGCLIDTPCGTVDARIDIQLETIKKSLRDALS